MTQIDVDHHVNTVRREVGTRVLDVGEANIVTISQVYPTDAADLWEACTDGERIARWFAPVTGALELGGSYQVEGNASGTVTSCDPPKSFTATWEFGGQTSWIEVRISPEGDSARLELDHIAVVGDDIWAQLGPGEVGIGWDLGLLGLAMYLASGQPMPPGFDEVFHTTDDGKRFIPAAAELWRQADVAFGTAPEAAAAAAERCRAFYLGEGTAEN